MSQKNEFIIANKFIYIPPLDYDKNHGCLVMLSTMEDCNHLMPVLVDSLEDEDDRDSINSSTEVKVCIYIYI